MRSARISSRTMIRWLIYSTSVYKDKLLVPNGDQFLWRQNNEILPTGVCRRFVRSESWTHACFISLTCTLGKRNSYFAASDHRNICRAITSVLPELIIQESSQVFFRRPCPPHRLSEDPPGYLASLPHVDDLRVTLKDPYFVAYRFQRLDSTRTEKSS